MIQSFYLSYNFFRNSKNKVVVILMGIAMSIFLWLLEGQGLKTNEDLEDKILSNIFDFSAIFSGLLIAFIIGKVFQLRNENIKRKEAINIISNKITDFRRICGILLNSGPIWSDEVKKPLSNHKNLTYFDFFKNILVKPHPKSMERVSIFFNDNNIKTETVSKFYLAIKDIALEDYARYLGGDILLLEEYDRNINYPEELLELWAQSNCAGQFWNCLVNHEGIAVKYFYLNRISREDGDRIKALAMKIDNKHQGSDLSHGFLSNIGNDFDQYYFPEIFNLTYLNNLAKTSMEFIINVLIGVILMGVLIPLILLSFNIDFNVKYYLTYACVISIALSLLWFVIRIKNLLKQELEIE